VLEIGRANQLMFFESEAALSIAETLKNTITKAHKKMQENQAQNPSANTNTSPSIWDSLVSDGGIASSLANTIGGLLGSFSQPSGPAKNVGAKEVAAQVGSKDDAHTEIGLTDSDDDEAHKKKKGARGGSSEKS